MATTTKYKLPLISGNMTADVVRDLNALANKTEEALDTVAAASANNEKLTQLEKEFEAHKTAFTTEAGVHNQRYFNGKYEIKIGDVWKPVASLMDSTPPGDVTSIAITPGNQKFTLTWVNPKDADFDKVKVVMKQGSEVQNDTDGEVIHEGKNTSVEKTGLTNDVTYHVRFFAIDTAGNVNNKATMKTSTMPTNVKGVTDFQVKQDAKGELFTLTWVNPVEATHQKTIVYASEKDLTNKTREQCAAGESGTITEIYSGDAQTDTHVTQPGKTYYFKAFAEHTGPKYDTGVTKSLLAKDTQPPGPVTELKAAGQDAAVKLTWTNPTDTDFKEVIVRYKTDAFPTDENDGTLATRGKVATHTVSSLRNDTEYFFKVFTVDNNGNVNKQGVEVKGTAIQPFTYGVEINTLDSNPKTAVVYTDDAASLTPASFETDALNLNGWDTRFPFNKIKPCVLRPNGTVNYYLNPDDFTLKEGGGEAKLDGTDGNVMIEFPKVYWKIERVGTKLHVRYSNVKVDDSYKCLAHMRGDIEKDKVYIGAYLANLQADTLSSKTDVLPTVRTSLDTFRARAKAIGSGYDLISFYQILMLQVLYVVMFRSLDSQTALGKGNVDNSAARVSGSTNKAGMFFGSNIGTSAVKFAGIEDIYGNARYFVDGIVTSSNAIRIGTKDFSNDGTGYAEHTTAVNSGYSGYLKAVLGTTELGFIPDPSSNTVSTSATSYYCDMAVLESDAKGAAFGGTYSSGRNSGMFALRIEMQPTASAEEVGARIMYL